MSMERFGLLAAAYGGVIARWPERERQAAERLARAPDAVALLAEAAQLDARLDAWAVPSPSATLARQIVATAPDPRYAWSSRARLWWSGLGIAAAMAGAAAGSFGAAAFTPASIAVEGATAFGQVDGEGPP